MAEWNAEVYARISAPQLEWGKRVLARLPLAGDETVLDAGCGAGRLTRLLLARLPRGRVVALDASEAMLVKARELLAPSGDQVSFVRADLATHAERPPVDAIFSTATFHWVLDHDALFDRLRESLRPGGLLAAQWGADGNLTRIRRRTAALRESAAFRAYFSDFREPWLYVTAEETRGLLESRGFVRVQVWREAAPARFDEAGYREFVTHVILRDDLARLPDDAARSLFVEALVDEARRDDPPFELDYWRLNADAARG
ncbi:MAG: class I SAM-dependent methyltransferase [Polyangiaceae bacterium]